MYSPSESSGPSAAKQIRMIEFHGMAAFHAGLPGAQADRLISSLLTVTWNQRIEAGELMTAVWG